MVRFVAELQDLHELECEDRGDTGRPPMVNEANTGRAESRRDLAARSAEIAECETEHV